MLDIVFYLLWKDFMKAAHFSKLCYRPPFYDLTLSTTNVAHTLQVGVSTT